MRILVRLLRRLMILSLVFGLVGSVYQAVGEAIDLRLYPAPGRMVSLGGFRLHLHCMGNGSPTVVMDAGLTASSLAWAGIQPVVARSTRVCSYDRAGYGWSDGGPLPRSSGEIVVEVHQLLARSGLKPPYVLVGHSFGGMNLLLYGFRYPRQVAGLVLVDSSNAEQFVPGSGRPANLVLGPCEIAAAVGFLRLLGLLGILPSPERAGFYRPAWCSAVFGEIAGEGKSGAEARAARRFLGDIPLFVLTRDVQHGLPPAGERFERQHQIWQAAMARLSSDSRQVVVRGAGHGIPSERPQVVVNAIRWVIGQVLAKPGKVAGGVL